MAVVKKSKEEIIKISIGVFRRQGYYQTSMSDLAKEAGMTKGAFYHHFNNKAEIMLTALQTMNQFFQKKLFAIAYQEEISEKERLDLILDYCHKIFTNGKGGCFFANTVLETSHIEDTFLEETQSFFNNWKQAIIQLLAFQVSEEEATEKAEQMIADMEGSLILMQLYKDETYLTKALNRAKNLLS